MKKTHYEFYVISPEDDKILRATLKAAYRQANGKLRERLKRALAILDE